MNKQDFESSFSGQEIDEAVGRGLGLNPFGNGWVKLTSTATSPIDLGTVFNPGNYSAVFVTGIPAKIQGISPVNFSVVNVPWGTQPNLAQVITYADMTYYRYKVGTTWDTNWTRAMTSHYIFDNAPDNPPANPENGAIWIYPVAGGTTMTMKVWNSTTNTWMELKAEGLMATSDYDPTNKKTDLFVLIDNKFAALKIDVDKMNAHMADKIIHITPEERVSFNDKVTKEEFATAKTTLKTDIDTQITTQTTGYDTILREIDAKNTATQNKLTEHAANAIVHVNQTDIDSWTSKAAADHTHFNDGRVKIDAKDITSGIFDLARIPRDAFNDVVEVADVPAMYKLTKAQVQNGDTVRVLDPPSFYFVVDDTKLNLADGYMLYSTGVLDSMLWENIRNKPTTIGGFGITDAYTKEEVDQQVQFNLNKLNTEMTKVTSASNYVVANDISRKVESGYYPLENLEILQGWRRENTLYPYAEADICDYRADSLTPVYHRGFNNYCVLPKYGTDDHSHADITYNQLYRIPINPKPTPWDDTPPPHFPNNFIDDMSVQVNYFHMASNGNIASGVMPDFTRDGDPTIRCIGTWTQDWCATNPKTPILVKKIRSYQYFDSTDPAPECSHICIIRERGTAANASGGGHLALAYESESGYGMDVFETPFLAPIGDTVPTDPSLQLKKRLWQGFMINPSAPDLVLDGITARLTTDTLNLGTTVSSTRSIDALLYSRYGFEVMDFDFDMESRTLVASGICRICSRAGNGTAANPRLTVGTNVKGTNPTTQQYPAVLICDIITSNQHPGSGLVGKPIPTGIEKEYNIYIVGLLPVAFNICPVSDNAALTSNYVNRKGLNFFESDAFATNFQNIVNQNLAVKRIPNTGASTVMGNLSTTADKLGAFMLYADVHGNQAGTGNLPPYPISMIYSAYSATSHDITNMSPKYRKTVFLTAQLPEMWRNGAAPLPNAHYLPNFQMRSIQIDPSNQYNVFFGSMASAKDVFNGTVCPWFIMDFERYYAQTLTGDADNQPSALANIYYRKTVRFEFKANTTNGKAFRINTTTNALSVKDSEWIPPKDSFYFVPIKQTGSNDQFVVMVNSAQTQWAVIKLSYDKTKNEVHSFLNQHIIEPFPTTVTFMSNFPDLMKSVDIKQAEDSTECHHYLMPLNDVGNVPYVIKDMVSMLSKEYAETIRSATDDIDQQRIATGSIWAKRGNFATIAGMDRILSVFPMPTPYSDTAFLGKVGSVAYIGYVTEYGEVHKRELIKGTTSIDLAGAVPNALIPDHVVPTISLGNSTLEFSARPEAVILLCTNADGNGHKTCIPNLYKFVQTINAIKNTDYKMQVETEIFKFDPSLCARTITGPVITSTGVTGADFSTSAVDDSNKIAISMIVPAPTTTGSITLIGYGNIFSKFVIDATVINPTNVTGKNLLYYDLIHSSDGIPIFFGLAGTTSSFNDATDLEAIVIIPVQAATAPTIIRRTLTSIRRPLSGSYFRSSHRQMYLAGKSYSHYGHPSFLTSGGILSLQILALTPKNTDIPRISIVYNKPTNLEIRESDTTTFIAGTILATNPQTVNNPTIDRDCTPIVIVGNIRTDQIPVYAYIYNRMEPGTATSSETIVVQSSYAMEPPNVPVANQSYPQRGGGDATHVYAFPGYQLAKTRDIEYIDALGNWYVTLTSTRAMSEQINYARMVQDAYTWKNQTTYTNLQVQNLWSTIQEAQPMIQSILNMI